MSLVDDFGRYEADPETLRSRLFWRDPSRWPVERIDQCLEEVSKQKASHGPLIALYEVAGKRYLQLSNLGLPRAKKSKYPEQNLRADARTRKHMHADASTREHMHAEKNVSDVVSDSHGVNGLDASRASRRSHVHADADICLPELTSPSPNTNTNTNTKEESEKPKTTTKPNGIGNPDYVFSDWFAKIYARHPKKKNKTLAEQAALARFEHASPKELARFDAVHAAWCSTNGWQKENGNFAPQLAEWISDEGDGSMPSDAAQLPGHMNPGLID